MILDLTTPLTEKSAYKNPRQREAWGSFVHSIILRDYSQESSWRTFFLRGKKETDTEPIIPDRKSIP